MEFGFSDIIADVDVTNPTMKEIEITVKSPSMRRGHIAAELIKNGGQVLKKNLYQLINKVWEDEILVPDWRTAIFKKNDKLV